MNITVSMNVNLHTPQAKYVRNSVYALPELIAQKFINKGWAVPSTETPINVAVKQPCQTCKKGKKV